MDTAEQQYQRDIARIEAHKLALKDDEFSRLTDLIRGDVREHARYLREERGAPIVLHDRDSRYVSVENADGLRSVTIAFDALRHEVTWPGHKFAVEIDGYGKAVVIGRNFGQLLGVVTQHVIITSVRRAVESITDLPRPIK
jgi:hypothetical protein